VTGLELLEYVSNDDVVIVVIDDVAEDALEVPIEFVAVTVNVYVVPDDKPYIVIGDDVPIACTEPGELVTV
jgi:hypothetical protein